MLNVYVSEMKVGLNYRGEKGELSLGESSAGELYVMNTYMAEPWLEKTAHTFCV